VSPAEIREALDLLAGYGIDITACTIDIRGDGITVSPGPRAPGNAYDEWKARDKGHDRLGRK
jgi:hypothetical protein